VKVGDVVKEKRRGRCMGIIVMVWRGNRVVRSGSVDGIPHMFVEVLYSDGELLKNSSNTYEVISEGR